MEKDIRHISRARIIIKHEPTSEDLKISALIRIADVLESFTVGKLALIAENTSLKDQLRESNKRANEYLLKYQKNEEKLRHIRNKIQLFNNN